jgi:hypothetical protein
MHRIARDLGFPYNSIIVRSEAAASIITEESSRLIDLFRTLVQYRTLR